MEKMIWKNLKVEIHASGKFFLQVHWRDQRLKKTLKFFRVVYDPDKVLGNTVVQGHAEKKAFSFDLTTGTGYTEFAEVEPTEYVTVINI